jgi:WS/DGAT/MGAT family acyltransferase
MTSTAPVERASSGDRAFLAMDTGPVPEQFGVVLGLQGHLDLAAVTDLLADRVPAVPRLRQRLVSVPFGLGGPIWVDDAAFDIGRHVHEATCPSPGDDAALLETALATVTRRLPRDAPLWSVVLVTGVQQGRSALVVVLHHVLADGIGGLAVLAAFADPGGGRRTGVDFPRRPPRRATLLADATRTRVRALAGAHRSWRLLRRSLAAGGGLRPPRIAPCSLMQRTGSRRQAVTVRCDVESLRAAARPHGATTNDALLVAVVGALQQVLEHRGEHVDELVVTVPVSGRPARDQSGLGNLVSPMLVEVPTTGALDRRLSQVGAVVRARRASALGPAPIAVIGWLFRPLAALGGYRWYMNHQHRFHTLVSHVRGPAEPLAFGGRRITDVVPVGVAESGNATVSFEALSYAGTLSVTAIVDPDRFPDTDVLAQALEDELRALGSPAAPGVTPVVRSRGGARPSTPRPRAGRPASP